MAIVRLTEELTRKIAAGEVVERPASVVKELVENAIDAGSERIEVEVEKGGTRSILVRDDGSGMDEADLRLSIERYATSKIRTESDLDSIRTLGFRGEALASIASVSILRIVSRTADATEAYELTARAGGEERLSPAARGRGTTVEVGDLFFNLPARARFLGTPRTEFLHVHRVIQRTAFASHEIGWRLTHDGRSVLDLPPAASLLDRIGEVHGPEIARALMPVEGHRGGIEIRGFVSRPDLRRGNRRDQLFMVNGRLVEDRGLAFILASAYRGLLRPGGYPIAIVRIDVPPNEVDVNIHPRKEEVRFSQSRLVQDALAAALHQTLSSRHMVAPVKAEAAREGESGSARRSVVREPQTSALGLDLRSSIDAAAREREAEKVRVAGDRRVIGQLQLTYLLVETPDGLEIIDQHIAHERVLYERLKAQSDEGGIPRQLFLLPVRLEVSFETAAILSTNREKLERAGIVLDEFGGGTFLLREYPRMLADEQGQAGFQELAEALAEALSEGQGLEDVLFNRLLSEMACTAAVKAGEQLTLTEAQRLVENLMTLDNPFACPHGRPIIFQLDRQELDRRFRRA
jgi:DNA mismatch repair protein MutL